MLNKNKIKQKEQYNKKENNNMLTLSGGILNTVVSVLCVLTLAFVGIMFIKIFEKVYQLYF